MALRTLRGLVDGLADNQDSEAIVAHQPGAPIIWTRHRLGTEVQRFTAGLIEGGVGAGEPVGLLASARPSWAAAMLGIANVGAIAMPLGEQLTTQELTRILDHSGCRWVITTNEHLKVLAALDQAQQLEIVLLDSTASPAGTNLSVHVWNQSAADLPALPPIEPDQPAALVYTSGTTGTPKGVPLSHANLCANIDALVGERLARQGDRVLLPLPLQHVYPLTVGLLAPLASGASVVLPAGITGPQISQALKDCACTIMIAVPRLYEAMLDGIERKVQAIGGIAPTIYHNLLALSTWLLHRFGWRIGQVLFAPLRYQIGPELHLLASGGAPLKPEAAWQLGALGWEVLVGYGLTETSPILSFNPRGKAIVGTAGLPLHGVEIRIAPMPDVEGANGEVQVRGPSVFSGYWRNAEATQESFTADGFFRTGDLGHLDGDGYLHLVGRNKEMIVVAGGKNIFPEDVEQVYRKNDLVEDVAALEQDGRLVGLFVPKAQPSPALPADLLHQRFREVVEERSRELPSYERITSFALTTQPLPRTQIGKLRRHLLPEIYERAKHSARPIETQPPSAQDRALLECSPADQVWAWLQKRFKDVPLNLDTSPELDLGLDSFAWMSLAMELQERFGVRLTEDAIGRMSSLRALLQEVQHAADSGQALTLADGHLDIEQERWLQPSNLALRCLARLLFEANRLIMRGIFRVQADGLEHLPEGGPFLITPNHVSFLDPFAVAAVLSWRQLQQHYWAGWSGILFQGPLTRAFSRAAQVVPVDAEQGRASTLLFALTILRRGNSLTWFPEGERSIDGELLRFLPGVGLLVQKNRCSRGTSPHLRHLRGLAAATQVPEYTSDPRSIR